MSKYTFFIEGVNKEYSVVASSEKDARQSIWKGLSDEEKNAVVVFDCIDIE